LAALRTAEAATKSTKERYRALIGKRAGQRSDAAGAQCDMEPVPPPCATVLAWIDGSEWSIRALLHLLQQPLDRVILLYIAPQASAGYVECGWMVLEAAMHRCRLQGETPPIECRLEVGDAASRILAVCREERPDVLAMGWAALNGSPRPSTLGALSESTWAACACQVVLASRRGIELFAGDRRLLVAPCQARARPPVVAGSRNAVEGHSNTVEGRGKQRPYVAPGGGSP
jgi:hypothetical protein